MRMYTRDVYTRDVYRQTTRADAVEIRQSDLNTSGDIRTRPGGQRWFPPDFSKRFFLPSFLSFFFVFFSLLFIFPPRDSRRRGGNSVENRADLTEREEIFWQGVGRVFEFCWKFNLNIWILIARRRGGVVFIGPSSRSLNLYGNLIWKGLG